MAVYDDTMPMVFNHPKLDLVEITVREVDIDTWQRYCAINAEGVMLDPADGDDPEAEAAKLAEVIKIVGDSLVSWNLDDSKTGRPYPCSAVGLRKLPKLLLREIVNTWTDTQVGVGDPFAAPSSDGAPLAETRQTPLAS